MFTNHVQLSNMILIKWESCKSTRNEIRICHRTDRIWFTSSTVNGRHIRYSCSNMLFYLSVSKRSRQTEKDGLLVVVPFFDFLFLLGLRLRLFLFLLLLLLLFFCLNNKKKRRKKTARMNENDWLKLFPRIHQSSIEINICYSLTSFLFLSFFSSTSHVRHLGTLNEKRKFLVNHSNLDENTPSINYLSKSSSNQMHFFLNLLSTLTSILS
jgi:hypothetical protein